MSTIRVGKTLECADVTFEQRERDLQLREECEKRSREREKKSAYSNFAQQNIEMTEALLRIADSPLATKIYFLIVKKMNTKNALVASYQFFMDYFDTSKSSVRRAIQLLETENILQIKRSGGASVYLLNPEVVWKGRGNQVQYCEFEGNILLTKAEWGDDDGK